MEHLNEYELALYVEYIDTKNPKNIPSHVMDHVKECDDCAAEALELFEMTALQQHKYKTKTIIRPLFYISTAIAASLLIFFLVYNFNFDTTVTETKNMAAVDRTTAKPLIKKDANNTPAVGNIKTDKIQYADNFTVDDYLEKMVSRFEGVSRNTERINIITPLEYKSSGNILLEWENRSEKELYVEILNNKGKLLNEYTSTGDSLFLKNKLSPGLYYWKLMNSDFDLLFCGKIILKR